MSWPSHIENSCSFIRTNDRMNRQTLRSLASQSLLPHSVHIEQRHAVLVPAVLSGADSVLLADPRLHNVVEETLVVRGGAPVPLGVYYHVYVPGVVVEEEPADDRKGEVDHCHSEALDRLAE